MFCFSCKAYEDFRKDVSLFDTAAVADVSHVMSDHDVCGLVARYVSS